MKIEFPDKTLEENIFDLRSSEKVGVITFDNPLIEEIFFGFSTLHLVLNITLKKEIALKMLEMKINDGLLFMHKNARVGIFNKGKKHHLLPETFWNNYISIVIPFDALELSKCDDLEINFKFIKEDKEVFFESENIKFQIRLKGEICTKK